MSKLVSGGKSQHIFWSTNINILIDCSPTQFSLFTMFTLCILIVYTYNDTCNYSTPFMLEMTIIVNGKLETPIIKNFTRGLSYANQGSEKDR